MWDFKHVKHLCGTGRLYVRLNVSKDTLVEDEEGSITETPAPAPSTSLPSTSAEAGPSGLHALSGFSLQSSRTLHQMLALVLFVVMTTRMN